MYYSHVWLWNEDFLIEWNFSGFHLFKLVRQVTFTLIAYICGPPYHEVIDLNVLQLFRRSGNSKINKIPKIAKVLKVKKKKSH